MTSKTKEKAPSRSGKKKPLTKKYQAELNNNPDKEAIERVLSAYPDEDREDGRANHDNISIDSALYNKLDNDINEIAPENIKTGIKEIAEMFLSVQYCPQMHCIVLAAMGYSLRKISAATGVNKDTIRTRFEKIRQNQPEIGAMIYPAKQVIKYPGGEMTK